MAIKQPQQDTGLTSGKLERMRTRLLRRIRVLLVLFMIGLLLSGLTAFPLVTELRWLDHFMHTSVPGLARLFPALAAWVSLVHRGLEESTRTYPFLAYGTDWLAFAHIMITIAFIGPFINPVRNRWVLEFGMIACVLVIPLALIMGPIRDIPVFHRWIDCAFGIVGFPPLFLVWWWTRRLEHLETSAV